MCNTVFIYTERIATALIHLWKIIWSEKDELVNPLVSYFWLYKLSLLFSSSPGPAIYLTPTVFPSTMPFYCHCHSQTPAHHHLICYFACHTLKIWLLPLPAIYFPRFWLLATFLFKLLFEMKMQWNWLIEMQL